MARRFSRDMLIKDAIALHPQAADVLGRRGLCCSTCLAAALESIESAAAVHDVPVDLLLEDLESLSSDEEIGTES